MTSTTWSQRGHDRTTVHRIIYDELVRGIVSRESKQAYVEVIEQLEARGAHGVIAG
jgi:aspartate racemase